jgi:hypothetical protein
MLPVQLVCYFMGAPDDRQEMKPAGYLAALLKARIFKRLWSPGIDSKE